MPVDPAHVDPGASLDLEEAFVELDPDNERRDSPPGGRTGPHTGGCSASRRGAAVPKHREKSKVRDTRVIDR